MRKALIWMLICTLLVGLTACGGESELETTQATSAPTAAETTVAATQAPTETTQPTREVTFQEMTAYEDERCKIQITGLTGFDRETGDHCVHVNFENKLEDKPLFLDINTTRTLVVNGVGFDLYNFTVLLGGIKADENANNVYSGFFIPAKESANGTITIQSDEYKKICESVGELTELGIPLYYYNDEDSSLSRDTPMIYIYPYGEENAVKAAREGQPTDKVIIDNEYVKMIATEFGFDTRFQNNTLKLFIENKTENGLQINTHRGETVINGETITDYYENTVEPGMCAYSQINWYKDDFKIHGIDQVETIDLALQMMTFDMQEAEKSDWVTSFWSEDFEVTLNP